MNIWQLDPTSSLPRHQQLEMAIKEAILRRQWLPGERIPSERDWTRMTGVNRATIRQAINALVQQNILTRTQGSGTYVAVPKLEQPLFTAYSFAEQIREQGQTLQDSILRQEVVPANEMATTFGLNPSDSLVLLERLRFLDGQTLMINTSFIPLRYVPDFLAQPLLGSLYRTLTERYGFSLDHSVDTLEAAVADSAQAARLQISRGAPIFLLRRLAYTRGNTLLHMGYNIVRADRCRFRLELPQQPARLEVL